MNGLVCDRCNTSLLVDDPVRYEFRIEIRAAYDPLEVTTADLNRDLEKEIRRTIDEIEMRSEADLTEEVVFRGSYDLCVACRAAILRNPLQK